MTENEYCQLYNSQRERAVAYASRLLGTLSNCAEDCVQTAFMDLWTAIQAKDLTISSPKTYLFTTLRNAVKKMSINECRQTDICKRLSHRKPCTETAISKTTLIDLHYTQGYTQTEIAGQMQCSQPTVSRAMSRELAELRERITNE
jgi:DNA-directed RNA polymerase specialized sigma24 family protein